jgi:adenine-specific DNA methylase
MPEHKKKLIEVALPLDAINKAAAREKSIRHGHPSTLHLWWARRPLAAARASLLADCRNPEQAVAALIPVDDFRQRTNLVGRGRAGFAPVTNQEDAERISRFETGTDHAEVARLKNAQWQRTAGIKDRVQRKQWHMHHGE